MTWVLKQVQDDDLGHHLINPERSRRRLPELQVKFHRASQRFPHLNDCQNSIVAQSRQNRTIQWRREEALRRDRSLPLDRPSDFPGHGGHKFRHAGPGLKAVLTGAVRAWPTVDEANPRYHSDIIPLNEKRSGPGKSIEPNLRAPLLGLYTGYLGPTWTQSGGQPQYRFLVLGIPVFGPRGVRQQGGRQNRE